MKRKRTWKFWLIPLLVVVLLLTPWIWWEAKPATTLQVAILDKTVPDMTYREHKGLVWLLNQQKYVKADQQSYDYTRDYYGFFPKADRQYETTGLPADLKGTDMIYVADTYGIERAQYDKNNSTTGDLSGGMLYGGLTISDIQRIRSAVTGGGVKTLIAEFNSLATPTQPGTRQEFYPLIGAEWTGWTGRYFSDLTRGGEVPAFLSGDGSDPNRWPYTGPGVVFVHEDGRVVVLEHGKQIGEEGVQTILTTQGKARLGLDSTIRYNYWFDVMKPAEGAEVLANYNLGLTDDGKSKLQAAGISYEFPAVIRQQHDTYVSYYFAGDYADYDHYSFWRKYQGWENFKRWLTFDRPNSEDAFYWHIYVPLMKSILQETAAASSK
ncbi:hypothetical protein [Paenibacillus shenyangensis]|uniref:hypothetical protein n=1 Tax=Paenibacillus sp. A9 TaxID=1284352 RepID=UPI00037C8063|nr:hypothetical protein [Paenibacillus sp. A9]